MSRQLEASAEAKQERRDKAVLAALAGGLHEAIARAGGELVGFSVKISFADCLLVIKADFPAGRQVSFVGSETVEGALLKAVREGRSDNLRWRDDRYA